MTSIRPASLVALGALLATALHAPDAEAGTQCKPSSVVSGVDLNPDGDGTLPWASSGTGFAIIKATQGDYYTDADFAANWAALKSAHVVRGAYHFFDATVSGVDQANYFLSVVGTIEPGDLPPTLDIECPVSGDNDCLGDGSSGAAPASQITAAMNDFLTTVKTATGLTPIVYSYGSWFSDNGVDTTGLEDYPLWIADYSGTDCFDVPTPWTAATLWQYDSSGDVAGVDVDDDYFLGSAAQLATFTSSGSLPVDGGEGDSGTDYGTCTVSATGDMGVCIDTSECASEGGTSTPDYCPGPANIQCCTGIKVEDGGAGDAKAGGEHDGGGGAPDAGGITPRADGGRGNGDAPPPSDGGGCACSLPRGPSPSSGLLLSSMVALMFATRRARRPRRRRPHHPRRFASTSASTTAPRIEPTAPTICALSWLASCAARSWSRSALRSGAPEKGSWHARHAGTLFGEWAPQKTHATTIQAPHAPQCSLPDRQCAPHAGHGTALAAISGEKGALQ